MDIGLFQDAGSVTIPNTVHVVLTSGFHTHGKGIARYKRMASAPTMAEAWGADYWWFQSDDGAYWELAEDQPNLLQFGGFDDAAKAYDSYTVTGTDNAPQLNALIFYCQYRGHPTAYIPAGGYLCEDVIHLGYGASAMDNAVGKYTHVNLKGEWPGYASWDRVGGTALYSNTSDRPLLNIQGQRNCLIEGIMFAGLFEKYVLDNNLCLVALSEDEEHDNDPKVDDRDIDQWFDDTLDANQDTRYTPYAAVTIDAYSGPRPTSPAASYPDATYPEFTGIEDQWNKGQSSAINFRYCAFEGFIAGVVSQPCDYDGNGDFIRFDRCVWQYNKYCVSIGNGQSRNVALFDCLGNTNHTLLEGTTHGRRLGRFQGSIVNFSCSSMMQIVNMLSTVGPPLTFYDSYFEGVDRIGNIAGASSGALTFVNGSIAFSMPTPQNSRGTPPNQFSGSSTRHVGSTVADTPLSFLGTNLQYDGALVLLTSDVTIRGGRMINTLFESEPTLSPYQALGNNALAGGIVTPNFGTRVDQAIADISCHFKVRNIVSGVPVGGVTFADGVWGGAQRAYGSPVYARQLQTYGLDEPVQVERHLSDLPKSARFTSLTLTHRDLTGTFVLPASQAEAAFIVPGDVLYDSETGLTFFVYYFKPSTGVMKAKLMNGYRGESGSETTTVSFSTSVGSLLACTGRVYTPLYPVFVTNRAAKAFAGATTSNGSTKVTGVTGASSILVGLPVSGSGIPADTVCIGVSDTSVYLSNAATASATVTVTFGAASATLTNVGNSAGDATAEASMAEGDYVASNGTTENLATPNGATIIDIDDATATMTLSSNALWPPVANRRLKALRVAPPANV